MIRPSTLIRHSPDRSLGGDDWRQDAACLDHDPDLFFVAGDSDAWEHRTNAAQLTEAKSVCAVCPAVAECLAEGQELGDRYAIRGGFTPAERERARRSSKRKSQAKAAVA